MAKISPTMSPLTAAAAPAMPVAAQELPPAALSGKGIGKSSLELAAAAAAARRGDTGMVSRGIPGIDYAFAYDTGCAKCGSRQHPTWQCRLCYKCQYWGHMGRDCGLVTDAWRQEYRRRRGGPSAGSASGTGGGQPSRAQEPAAEEPAAEEPPQRTVGMFDAGDGSTYIGEVSLSEVEFQAESASGIGEDDRSEGTALSDGFYDDLIERGAEPPRRPRRSARAASAPAQGDSERRQPVAAPKSGSAAREEDRGDMRPPAPRRRSRTPAQQWISPHASDAGGSTRQSSRTSQGSARDRDPRDQPPSRDRRRGDDDRPRGSGEQRGSGQTQSAGPPRRRGDVPREDRRGDRRDADRRDRRDDRGDRRDDRGDRRRR